MRYTFFVVFCAVLFSSCSTDLDLNADYKEKAVVYGLLSTQDDVHYLRIQKAFLGEGNALDMAASADSIYYGEDFNGILQEIRDGKVIMEHQLTKVDGANVGLPKEGGIFASNPNTLYRIDGVLNDESSYMLRATNFQTGYEISAETPLVKDFSVSRPSVTLTGYTVNMISPTPIAIQWVSAVHGRTYDVIVRFHYKEWRVDNPQKVDTLYIDWVLAQGIESNTSLGGQQLSISLRGEDFYNFLRARLTVDPVIRREVLKSKGPLDFFFRVGGEHVYQYMRINRAQTGLTQLTSRASYTNVNNGLGFLSSTYTKLVPNISISSASVEELACGEVTFNLNFLNSAGSRVCP